MMGAVLLVEGAGVVGAEGGGWCGVTRRAQVVHVSWACESRGTRMGGREGCFRAATMRVKI